MARRLTALTLALVATATLAACGGGEETGDVIPRETPELATPGEGSTTLPAAAAQDDATATTDTTDTTDTATDDATAAPADPTTQAPATQTPAATTPAQSGGTAAPQTGGTTGGTGTGGTADPGGFSDFCTQNPGACDN